MEKTNMYLLIFCKYIGCGMLQWNNLQIIYVFSYLTDCSEVSYHNPQYPAFDPTESEMFREEK